jgi:hypothetical protein
MTVHCYTSFSLAYLGRARVLAASLRTHHPDWKIWAILSDRPPEGFALDREGDFDHILWAEDLFEDLGEAWLFQHNVIELCTAVKGRAAQRILSQPGCTRLLYFDPDIAVFSDLSPVLDALDTHSTVLTPHQLTPETDDIAIRDNEIASLHYGTFNLGFLGLANDERARQVVDWWTSRLERWCHDRLDIGVFVDQKWFNLVPCFFEGVGILRHPGMNVASWNISQRHIDITTAGDITVNGAPLGFYHFTKIGGAGDTMTERYANGNIAVFELWAWYRLAIERHEDARIPAGWWGYGSFEDGAPIAMPMRRIYRQREDLRKAFPNPFRSGPGTLQSWLAERPFEWEGL